MAQDHIETRLVRIEERLISLDEKLERYLEQIANAYEKLDGRVNGLTKDVSSHSVDLGKNQTQHKLAGGLITILIGLLCAWIDSKH